MSRASEKLIAEISPAIITASLKSFLLSKMTEHELLEVVEIEEACGLSRWGWEAYHAELSRAESVMLVIRQKFNSSTDNHVCGFVASRVVSDELHINNIAVREEFRRHGIASVLLAAALTEGSQKGARKALLEVRAGNIAAQSLYEKHGFECAGRRRNYYKQPPEDALLMRATID